MKSVVVYNDEPKTLLFATTTFHSEHFLAISWN